ncbi:hypothetical protein [Asticcacaulis sp.]|uniref:hypothetical protein n=1 Tax=Asticcacaulis sp. TaxID=1872648 RepID=UPI002B6E5848|nr:hypothetical protein [Asticcacaulis sp.]HTM82193.1 hypothetical protein [Asticcacaulis sp.]
MNSRTITDTHAADLVDLGAIASETKGTAIKDIQDDNTTGANQKFPIMGSLTTD